MTKRLGIVALLLLAINFLIAAGGVAYLFGTGKLDKDRVRAIGKIVFPEPVPASQPTSQPTTEPTGDSLFSLDKLLDEQAGKTAAEQVQVVRDAYESFAAQLDRQRREVIDLRRQVDAAQAQITSDRAALAAQQQAFNARVAARTKQNADAGFKQSLQIFDAMDTKQIKDAFSSMDDASVVRYLQAMEPRRVSRIVKEFTAPEDMARANRWLALISANADSNVGSGTRDASSAPNGSTTTSPPMRPAPTPTPTPVMGR